MTTIDDLREYFLRLPHPGVKAADLTDRDKVALANAAGVKCEIVTETVDGRHMMRMHTKQLVGFADGADGKLIVAIRQPYASRQGT